MQIIKRSSWINIDEKTESNSAATSCSILEKLKCNQIKKVKLFPLPVG